MKRVVVTGANRGLGLAIASRLLGEKYDVIAIVRHSSPELEDLRESLIAGQSLQIFTADLSDTGSIHELSARIQREAGPVFGLVNNAALGLDGLLATHHETDISAILKVNLHAPILLCKYLSRSMLLKRKGRIINISSIIASTGFNGLAVYGASKAGLVGLTQSLARELGRAGITVNCICPGFLETAMTAGLDEVKLASIRRRSPMDRFASIEEVAVAVSFLLSDAASGITGTSLKVDAGSTA